MSSPNKENKVADKDPKKNAKDTLPQDELTEEDQALKEKLELCVERLTDSDAGLRKNALSMIKEEVCGATTSMTSVPKPLKFLTPLYDKLVEAYNKQTANDDFKVSPIA
jgi:26S proteasome regulatory subunit N1